MAIAALPAPQQAGFDNADVHLEPATQPVNSVTVHYWAPQAQPYRVGHVSMTLPDGTYISWFPQKQLPISDVSRGRTLTKDTTDEGGAPDDYVISGVDTKKFEEWWKKFEKDHKSWIFSGPNCTTVVEEALTIGGAKDVPTGPEFVTPAKLLPALKKLSNPPTTQP